MNEENNSLKSKNKEELNFKIIYLKGKINTMKKVISFLIIIIILLVFLLTSEKLKKLFRKNLNNEVKEVKEVKSIYKNGKKLIKLGFADFNTNFNQTQMYPILNEKYILSFQSNLKNADYIIYSSEKTCNHLEYKDKILIFITFENFPITFEYSDYAISFEYIKFDDRYLRSPQYFLVYNYTLFNGNRSNEPNRKFCGFLVSNPYCETRNKFFEELSKYKKVDSGGFYKNNIKIENFNNKTEECVNFFKHYKFAIVFENTKNRGYITEKIWNAFSAGCIPIYWGDETVTKIINPKSFIYVENISDFSNKINLIKEIDQNDTLYNQYLNEPVLLNKSHFQNLKDELKNFLYNLFDQEYENAKRRRYRPYWYKSCHG